MATKTANYNLVKPLGKEKVDIDVINANMDVIDTTLKGLDNSKVSLANSLTTTEEGYALDATQGKMLADRVSEVNSGLSVEATQMLKGLMSATDKAKLDGIAANANNYVHPNTTGNKHMPSGGTVGQILRNIADGTATWQDLLASIVNVSTTTQSLYGQSNVDTVLQSIKTLINNLTANPLGAMTRCKVRVTSDKGIRNALLPFDVIDTNIGMTVDLTAYPTRAFTVPTGVTSILIMPMIMCGNNSSGYPYSVTLYKNGAQLTGIPTVSSLSGSNGLFSGAIMISVTSGDYFGFYCANSNIGGAVLANSEVSVLMLG